MRLLIISHTDHYILGSTVAGWGATVREIDHLANLFEEVVHLAPLRAGLVPSHALPYISPRVRLKAVHPAGGDYLRDKLGILNTYPSYWKAMQAELKTADMVHVRCPANISLLALLLLALTRKPKYRWFKYAGNWRPENKNAIPSAIETDPWTYVLQRAWLQRHLSGGIVTVNGRWPGQPSHVHSFLNPSLLDSEIETGEQAAAQKQLHAPYQLLYVGLLATAKGVGQTLQIVHRLQQNEVFRQKHGSVELHLVGDGPERPLFEAQARSLNLLGDGAARVYFHGWLPRPALQDFYNRAHFFLLPSMSEGWPKVLSEAMACGVIPLASAVSSIPQILNEYGIGADFELEDIDGYVNTLLVYLENPKRWREECLTGPRAAKHFTYSAYLHSLQRLFQDTWGIPLPENPQTLNEPLSSPTIERSS